MSPANRHQHLEVRTGSPDRTVAESVSHHAQGYMQQGHMPHHEGIVLVLIPLRSTQDCHTVFSHRLHDS